MTNVAKVGLRFPRVGIFGKPQGQEIAHALGVIAHTLMDKGCELVPEHNTSHYLSPVLGKGAGLRYTDPAILSEMGGRVDLVVVVGGDGTLLAAARSLAPQGVPLVGVNQGRLGFMTDISMYDQATALSAIVEGSYDEEYRPLLLGRVWRGNAILTEQLALNDVVIGSGGVAGGMVDLQLDINDQFVYQLRSDGLILATPTGSTAYALAAQGPIMHPCLSTLVLVPLAAHTLSNRPVVIDDSSRVKVTLTRAVGRGVLDFAAGVAFDGQLYPGLQVGDYLEVVRSEHTAHFLYPRGHDYFRMLREKLHWNTLPHQSP